MVDHIHCEGLCQEVEPIPDIPQVIDILHLVAPVVHEALVKQHRVLHVPDHHIPTLHSTADLYGSWNRLYRQFIFAKCSFEGISRHCGFTYIYDQPPFSSTRGSAPSVSWRSTFPSVDSRPTHSCSSGMCCCSYSLSRTRSSTISHS